MKRTLRLETQLIHAGEEHIQGAVNMPVFQSTSFATRGDADYHAIVYPRLSNTPNHELLHKKLAVAEGAEAGLVTASGMAAISASLLAVVNAGDHLIAQDTLYGGTHSFITRDLQQLGIEVSLVDAQDPGSWERALRPKTRAVYFESLTNPLLQVADLEAAVEFARAHRLVSLIDNTFTTPIGFRPIERGFDLSLHSATKYLNGHSDLAAGAVLGSRALVAKVKHKLDHFGGSLDPHTCFLLNRGLKTLPLRFRFQSESALQLARFLEKHPSVAKVNHPGLESHPQNARARRLFAAMGGMLSFELRGGVEAVERLFSRLQLPLCAPSLGGCETLVTQPAKTSHVGLRPEERAALGIGDGLVRVSVGIEATEDLLDDFGQALDGAKV